MIAVFNWHFAVTMKADLFALFGDIGSAIKALIETIAAMRTTDKFLIACGMQLITILVMLSRAMINLISLLL